MRKHIKLFLLSFFIINLSFNQTTSLFKQQNEIVTMIKNQVYSIIELGTELNTDQFGVWVDAELVGKPLPLKSVDAGVEFQSAGPEIDLGAISELLTGSKPTIPTPGQAPQTQKSSSKNGKDYYISGLVIKIYLDENIESISSLQTNIKSLVENQLTGVLCEDCIEFKLKNFGVASTAPSVDIQDKLDIEKARYDSLRRVILINKLTARDSIIATYTDQINEHVTHLQTQDSIKQAAERERMLRLEQNEKKYRGKQDSLYVLTSIKLDEAVRGRIQSEENTKKELLDVIKMQIKGDTSQIDVAGYSDETQSNLFNKRPVTVKRGLSTQMWLMIVALVLLMVILLIMVMKNKEPVYLKPKDNNSGDNGNNTPSIESEANPYVPTQANENEEVLKSELQSLRQTAVSMSVSEKTGANQIVQDWLDDSGAEGGADTPEVESVPKDNETESKK